MTHGRQTSSAAHVPARKGLAADLINKFNQMSASPDSEPAAAVLPRTQRTSTNISTSISTSTSTSTWGRRSLTPRSAASSMLSEPPNRAKTSPQSATERAACAKKDTETAAVLSSPDRRSWSQQQLPSSLSQSHAAIIEPRVDSLVSGDSNTAVSTAEQHQVLARPSPFLTDSEMGRALLEIKEFSQEMNLGLLDDGDEL
ncbi:hypothetical protein GQ54DRAFT_311779 [Martensiomyces pterosporus]|nr:hypothetical protein GQ54DRAFT_311779 [Martensiomyces pterosporus]